MRKRYLFNRKLKKVSNSTGKVLFDYKTFIFSEYMAQIKSGNLTPHDVDQLNGKTFILFRRINDRLIKKGYVIKDN